MAAILIILGTFSYLLGVVLDRYLLAQGQWWSAPLFLLGLGTTALPGLYDLRRELDTLVGFWWRVLRRL